MPSRHSQRGEALRRQLERAEAAQSELRAAEEERARFEDEFDYYQRVGFEEWDNLDNDTRADLLRASLGELVSSVGSAAANRNPASAAAKRGIRKMFPKLYKKIYARGPSKSREKLIDKIKRVRAERAASKAEKEKGIARAEAEIAILKLKNALGKGEKFKPAMGSKDYASTKGAIDKTKAATPWWESTIATGTGLGTRDAHSNLSSWTNARELLANDSEKRGTRIKPELMSLANAILEAGERRGQAYLSSEERELRKKQREERRRDDPYTATDQDYEAAFRRAKENLHR